MGSIRAKALERTLHSKGGIGRAQETQGALRIGRETAKKEGAAVRELAGERDDRVELHFSVGQARQRGRAVQPAGRVAQGERQLGPQ